MQAKQIQAKQTTRPNQKMWSKTAAGGSAKEKKIINRARVLHTKIMYFDVVTLLTMYSGNLSSSLCSLTLGNMFPKL